MGFAAELSGTPLLERWDAVVAIDALADDVEHGAGRVAVIEAGAGLGKTALLDAAAERLATRGMRVLHGRGSELERDFPYGIVRQLLAPIVRAEQLFATVFTGAAAPARALVTGGVAAPATTGTEPFEIMHALYWTLANLCDQGPVALLVDDAHDADMASQQLLSFLSRRLVDLPLLLVVAARPTAAPAHELDASATISLALAPLSDDAVATVLRDTLGSAPEPAFVSACARATGGNPFYLRELVRAVQEHALAPSAASARWVAELGPAAIVRRTLFRLASLAAAAVPLAQALAVLGDGAELWPCARLAGISLDDAAAAADALVRGGIFAAGPRLAFLHPILQSAVLADLGDYSRRRWHARAAQILDEAGAAPEVIALHVMRADPSGNPRVRDILVQAGRAAARDGSPAAAAQLLRRAIDESPDEPDADLRYELGFAQASLGTPDGLALMLSGVRATTDPAQRARRAVRLANFQMRSGDLVEAVGLLEEVRTGVEDPDLVLSIDATRYWAGRLHPATRPAAMELADQLLPRLDGPDSAARRTALAYLACEAAQTGSAATADELFQRALAAPGLLHFVPYDAVAVHASMLSLASIERHDAFDQLADAVLDEAGRRGSMLAFLVVSTFRAMSLLRRGDLGSAEAEAREALTSAADQGWQPGAASLAAIRSTALLEQGDVSGAEQALAAAEHMHVAPGFPAALLLRARGRLRAEQGDILDGVEALMACGDTLEGMRICSPGIVPWRSDAAVLLAIHGDIQRARKLAEDEVDLARRLAGPIATGRALHAVAQTTRGGERVALLREAYRLVAPSTANLTRAVIAVELGATLRREKQPAEAHTYLAEGLEIAARCRCLPLAARAHEELAVVGVVPRRTLAFGPSALTPSELRVARLAAAGRTNAEIAQRLFVTRKTVEKHLASTYRKLGIDSRGQLDARELEHALPPG